MSSSESGAAFNQLLVEPKAGGRKHLPKAGSIERCGVTMAPDGGSDRSAVFDLERFSSIESMYGRQSARNFVCAALDEAEHQLRRVKAAIELEDYEGARRLAAQLNAIASSWAAKNVARSSGLLSSVGFSRIDAEAAVTKVAAAIAEARHALFRGG